MAGQRKHYSAGFKAQVAIAALKGDKTVNQLAGEHSVHPTLIHTWKKQLLGGAEDLFSGGRPQDGTDHAALEAQLFEQIGRLEMELDWVKKKSARLG
jgi:transposase-like protein